MYGQVVNVTRPSSDIQAFVFKWDIYIVPDLMRLRIDVFLFYDIRYYFFGILIYTRGNNAGNIDINHCAKQLPKIIKAMIDYVLDSKL